MQELISTVEAQYACAQVEHGFHCGARSHREYVTHPTKSQTQTNKQTNKQTNWLDSVVGEDPRLCKQLGLHA